jgi:methionine-gamma-lyase
MAKTSDDLANPRPAPALATRAARAGVVRAGGGARPGEPHVEPLYQTAVYDFPSLRASVPALAGEDFVYARHGLPNAETLARVVAELEGAEAGLATTSGMSAIAAVVIGSVGAGDRIVVQRDAYGGCKALFDGDLARLGVTASYVDAYDPGAVGAALAGARLLLCESIANPLLRAAPLQELADLCRRHNVISVCDNTFATPLGCRPLAAGIDVVVHSATKFLGGHHDLLAGVAVGPTRRIDAARGVALRMGLMASPLDSWLAVRGIRTLDVRWQRACANSAELARRLDAHPAVGAVFAAPGCAMVTFDVGSQDAAEALVGRLAMIRYTPSLGGTTTTVMHPATSSHRALSAAERAAFGIGPGLMRMSVGIEAVDDVWAELDLALNP